MRSILFFAMLLPALLWAQEGGRLSFEKFGNFRNTTTLVVLYDTTPGYNEAIQQVFRQSWNITPYRFIQENELLRYASDEAYSMIVRDNSEKTHSRTSGTTLIRRNHLAIYPCGKGAPLKNYGGKEAVAQFRMVNIDLVADYTHLVPLLVRTMQQYLRFLEQETLTEDNFETKFEYFRNAQVGKLASMRLLIDAGTLSADLVDEAALRAAYTYDFERVETGAMADELAPAPADAALLYLSPDGTDLYVIGIAEGEILYHAYRSADTPLQAADLEKIASAVATPPQLKLSVKERMNKFFGVDE
ncbi:MAG: hypothetical protein OHK0039_45740 [Bacteroidia bacterium]